LHIQMTEEAKARLLEITSKHNQQLQLVYDTDGCGCAVSGVPSLMLIQPGGDPSLENASDEELPIYYQKQQAVFFEPSLYLSYNDNQNGFRLSSKNQIYQNAMTIKKSPDAN